MQFTLISNIRRLSNPARFLSLVFALAWNAHAAKKGP
jgi:hypothetical protein